MIIMTMISYLLEFLLDLESAQKERTTHCIFHLSKVGEDIVLGEDLTPKWTARHTATVYSVGSRPVDYRPSSRQTCRCSASRRP